MKHVPVPPPRSTFTETADGVELVILTRRSWLVIAFAIFFLIPWTIVPSLIAWQFFGPGAAESADERSGTTAADRRSSPEGEQIPMAIVAIVPFFALAVVGAVGIVLGWQFAGRVRVRIDADSLVLRRHIGPIGISRAYRRADVRSLRTIAEPAWQSLPFNRGHPMGMPKLAFDYGSTTIRFANALDESEARSVVRLLGQRGLVHVEPT